MTMNDAAGTRARILGRLTAAPRRSLPAEPPPGTPVWAPPRHGAARFTRFRAMLEAARAEVHEVTVDDWPQTLRSLLIGKGVSRLLYAPDTAIGRRLAALPGAAEPPTLIPYDRPVEELKPVLVNGVDAALTTARCGIADTGSLVLWPTPEEPRLMSLLPPLHAVLIEETALTDSLSDTIAAQGWAGAMPANLLMVSGPSKTADIEQTLAYGVHGPRELIVLVIRS
ncbi:MAG: lactate utilization protein [Rhodospirillaceae bacterium]